MGVFAKFSVFNTRLALACAVIAVSTFNYGFDNQAFSTTQAMDAFDRQFGVLDPKTKKYILEPYWLSLFNSLNYIGFAFGTNNHSYVDTVSPLAWIMYCIALVRLLTARCMLGVFLGSIISARFGRRWCMFSMSCYAIVTATIAVTSVSREQIMAARILNYVYVGMELAVVPTFQSEIGEPARTWCPT